MKQLIVSLIQSYALQYNVDPYIALSVVELESGFNPTTISSTGDYGLFQLHRSSFPDYSEAELLDPIINVKLGIQYLSLLKLTCSHRKDFNWLVCFNYGPIAAKHVKHPELFPYVKKVTAIYNKRISRDSGSCLKSY